MWKSSDRPESSLRIRSPLQNGLMVACGCLFGMVGISGLTVGRESGDWSGFDAILCCLSLLLGVWAVVAGWRQGVVLVGDQIVVRRAGKRTIRLEKPTAVRFDSCCGLNRAVGFGFVLQCLAVESEDGALTRLSATATWRRFPGHDRIMLKRALVVDDMICRIRTGSPQLHNAQRKEHFQRLLQPPTVGPRHRPQA